MKKGQISRFKGRHHTEASRKKMSEVHKLAYANGRLTASNFVDYSKNSGSKHYHWKGGRNKTGDGLMVNIAPGRYRLEHRLVVEKALGRNLKRTEYVHHINGNKFDNRNSNLLVCDNSYHVRLHNKMGALYAKEHFVN